MVPKGKLRLGNGKSTSPEISSCKGALGLLRPKYENEGLPDRHVSFLCGSAFFWLINLLVTPIKKRTRDHSSVYRKLYAKGLLLEWFSFRAEFIRPLVHEETELLTVLKFPFRVRILIWPKLRSRSRRGRLGIIPLRINGSPNSMSRFVPLLELNHYVNIFLKHTRRGSR